MITIYNPIDRSIKRREPLLDEITEKPKDYIEPSMMAEDNIPKQSFFMHNGIVYQATRAIPRGSEIKPNVNCAVKSFNDMVGGK